VELQTHNLKTLVKRREEPVATGKGTVVFGDDTTVKSYEMLREE
jgi:hypothetical protein